MKPITVSSFVCVLAPLVSAIWPVPESYTHGSTVLWISNNVPVTYSSTTGNSVCWLPTQLLAHEPYSLDAKIFWIEQNYNTKRGSAPATFDSKSIVDNAVDRARNIIFNEG